MPRTPDQIMKDFEAAAYGRADYDIHLTLDEILQDVLDSVKLACTAYDEHGHCPAVSTVNHIFHTVDDYVANHYGEN